MSYYIQHFGIPGMKWGVRKAQPTKSPKKASSKQSKSDYAKERSRQKKYLVAKRSIAVGRIAANAYLKKHQYALNGIPIKIPSAVTAIAQNILDNMYMKKSL